MKNRIIKRIIVWILAIIIIANIPIATRLFGFFLDEGHYRYSNSDGTSTYVEFKSHNFEMGIRRNDSCNLRRPKDADPTMYRLFTKNPLAFWRWGLYFYDERYKLPYKDWNEIKNNRKIIYGAGCNQSF
jgi:hypothetical protein